MTTTKHELAAQVMLQHRLNNLLRISDTVEIDTSYITCAEYQLFIDEKLKQGEYRQPDHWTDTRFSKGDARKPIAGVRFSDAKEFCHWLTNRSNPGTDFHYRLPTVEEASQSFVDIQMSELLGSVSNLTDTGTWCNAEKPEIIASSRPQLAKAMMTTELDDACKQISNRIYVLQNRQELNYSPSSLRDLALGFVRRLGHNLYLDMDSAIQYAHRVMPSEKIDPVDHQRSNQKYSGGRLTMLEEQSDLFLHQIARMQASMNNPPQKISNPGIYQPSDFRNFRDEALMVALNLLILSERIRGNLSAWEGIRIVRERIAKI